MPRVLRRPLAIVTAGLVVLVVLGLVVRGDNAVTRWDADVVAGVAVDRTAGIVDVARLVTDLGNGLVLGLLLLAAGTALAVGRVLAPRAAFAPVASLLAGMVLAPAAKAVVERPRPPAALHEVVERSSGYPSGHSAQSAAGWLALGLVLAYAPRIRGGTVRRAPVLAACALVVLLVGVSRVVLGVHSPTDVLAGWLLGVLCAVVVVGIALRGTAVGAQPRRDDPRATSSTSASSVDSGGTEPSR